MESRFTFLDDKFPKLSDYGLKAEHSITSDPNICFLSLGRIAELITDNLCRRNNIPDTPEKLNVLTEKSIITDDISRKILALTDLKHEAADNGYASQSACSRLMITAEELCRWFVSNYGESRFDFLADLLSPDKFIPVLINLAELGREAEDNLYVNTRYCIICLGDIGEAAADRLISGNSIETHETDQIDRIGVLAEKYIVPDDIKDILHELRISRNKAVHERYNDNYTSESEGRRLLNDALELCEWLFRLMMKPGYLVKARITGSDEKGFCAEIGQLSAYVPFEEVTDSKKCVIGKKYVFKIVDTENEIITLSLSGADKDYKLSLARLYAKYKPGQDVHVTIKSISNSTGAIVELKDGLEARIPKQELGRKVHHFDDKTNERLIRYETVARVKWFSLTQYPPMLLSVKDVENDTEPPQSELPQEKPPMPDVDFRVFCRDAVYENIIQALDEGANPNSTNSNNTTALMMAAQYNKNARVVKALVNAGAKINEQNHKGNTALMYAAMSNTPEVVKALYDAGADIHTVNNEGRSAADFAVSNRKLNSTDWVKILRGMDIEEEVTRSETETVPENSEHNEEITHSETEAAMENITQQEEITQSQTEAVQHEDEEEPQYFDIQDTDGPLNSEEDEASLKAHRTKLQRDFLRICRSGSEDEIAEAVSAGVNVNVTNKSSATALMFAAQSNTAQAVEILIHAGARINAQDDRGNTALIYAVSYNNDDVVDALIDAGADRNVTNLAGHKAADYAAKNYRLNDTEAVKRL